MFTSLKKILLGSSLQPVLRNSPLRPAPVRPYSSLLSISSRITFEFCQESMADPNSPPLHPSLSFITLLNVAV